MKRIKGGKEIKHLIFSKNPFLLKDIVILWGIPVFLLITCSPSLQAEPNPSSDLASVGRSETVTRRENVAPAMPSPSIVESPEVPRTSRAAASRVTSESLPKVGDISSNPQKRTRTTQSAPRPVGSAPAPPTVAIARVEASDRLLSPIDLPNQRQQATSGAQLSMTETAGASSQVADVEPSPAGAEARNSELGEAGLPAISEGDSMRAPAKVARPIDSGGIIAGDTPSLADIAGATPGEMNEATAAGSLLDGRIAPAPVDEAVGVGRTVRVRGKAGVGIGEERRGQDERGR